MKHYKCYLFDFDGTLFDTLPSLYRVYIESFKHIGISVKKEDCLEFFGTSLETTFNKMNPPKEKFEEFCNYLVKLLNDEETVKNTLIYPDTKYLFKKLLKKKVSYGIVTGNNSKHINDVFDFFDIKRKNLVIVGSDSKIKQKPNKEPIYKALELLHYTGDLKDVVYIGDTFIDEETAKNAGVSFLMINRQSKNKKCINTFREII